MNELVHLRLKPWGLLAVMCLLALLASCVQPGGRALGPAEVPAQPDEALTVYAAAQWHLMRGELEPGSKLLAQAAGLDPKSGFLQLEQARLYAGAADGQRSLAAAQKAVELSPKLVNAWLLLGSLYSNRKELGRAVKAYEKVIELDPDQEEARLFLGTLYLEDGRLKESAKVLQGLVDRRPDLALARYYLGQVQAALKHYAAAEKEFTAATKLSPRFTAARFELAKLYEIQSKNQKARDTYLEILRRSPDSARAHDLLGRLYLRTGRYQEALHEFAIVKGLSRDDVEVRIKIGLVYYEQGRYDQAAEELRAVLREQTDNNRARYYLGVALQDAGKPGKALAAFRLIPDTDELFVDALLHRAEILDGQDKRDQAVELLIEQIRLWPRESDLMVALAALREAQGDLPEAEKLLRLALEREPNNAETHFRLGVVLDKMDLRPAGLAQMKKAIELDDRHARALNYLGYTLAEESKDLDGAERLIRRALAVEPYSGYILDSLGWVYYQRGQYQQALEYLERAISTREEDPVIFEHVGDAAMKLKLWQRSAQAYEKALERKHPKADEIKRKLKRAQDAQKIHGSGKKP